MKVGLGLLPSVVSVHAALQRSGERLTLGSSWSSKNLEDYVHIKVQVWDNRKGRLEGADNREFSTGHLGANKKRWLVPSGCIKSWL